MLNWHVYILECSGGRLYTGATTDVARRVQEHRSGKGGKFTRAFGVVRLIYTEACPDKSGALVREAEIKKWPRAKKLALGAP
ncbi:MAG: GIY-YIG nuclease family protein [Candidatus Omnitrophota bacterium]